MSNSTYRTKILVLCAVFTAMSYAVTSACRIIPNVGGFLSFDFKDAVICIGAFLIGPVAGIVITIVSSFLEMVTYSTTGPYGFFMNVVATCAFFAPAAFFYQKKRTQKSAILGLICGTAALTATMLLWNYILTPLYFGLPRAQVVAMLPTLILPFNLVKGALNSVITLLTYKPIVRALRRANLAPEASGEASEKSIGFYLTVLFLAATLIFMGLSYLKII